MANGLAMRSCDTDNLKQNIMTQKKQELTAEVNRLKDQLRLSYFSGRFNALCTVLAVITDLKDKIMIEKLDQNDKDFESKLDFALNTDGSSSDYRNDRDRPYNGQPWTNEGIRGKQEVKGITMRDIHDCLIQAMLVSSGDDELSDKVFEISNDKDIGKGTKYAAKGTWRKRDIYKIDFNKVDPIAVAQNLTWFIEHYMGIYPNVGLEGIPSTDEIMNDLCSED